MSKIHLNDKSQSFDLMIELLFELNCQINNLCTIMSVAATKNNEEAKDVLDSIVGDDFAAYQELYLEELSNRFDLKKPG